MNRYPRGGVNWQVLEMDGNVYQLIGWYSRNAFSATEKTVMNVPDHWPQAQLVTEANPLSPWYVVYTKPRQETRALENLARQQYETWLPCLTTWRRQTGCWTRKSVPMFPRYMFLRTRDREQSLEPVRSTLGVSDLVRLGSDPAVVTADIIEELRKVESASALADASRETPFRRGDAVEVVAGPLAGLAGIVTRTELERVAVLVSLLGREKEVLFESDHLVR